MKFLNNKFVLITFGLLAILLFLTNKVTYLTAEPGEDKDCEPISANSDDEKRTIEFVPSANLDWLQKAGTINDASCVDETSVYGVVKITSEDDIKEALTYAKDNNLKVSMAGAKHSMGGHAFSVGNLVLDMTGFNKVEINESSMSMKVASGATWHDIQNLLHPRYAVKAMQSTDIFTVGGSISVNAHGMDHQAGALENSIRSMRVMLADGSVKEVSRDKNVELYEHVVGGYGLFAVILDVELEIVANDVYESSRELVNYDEFADYYESNIEPNKSIGLMYTHLSTAPGEDFLKEGIVYRYETSPEVIDESEVPPLGEISSVKLRRLVMNLSKQGPVWQKLRWWSEKYLEPKMESCSISRNEAQRSGEACLVARNEPMHDSVPYLRNSLKGETDILHEYFIPRTELTSFVDGMREIMKRDNTNLLNASIRVVNKERGVLTYAPEPAFSVVLYINQKTDAAGHAKMAKLTSELIDLTHAHNGRFFLPYQLHYTKDQLQASYPNIDEFFAKKRIYDPEGLFSNTWYERYSS